MVLTRVRSALAKPFMPVVFFFAGVTYDTVTLTRIDRLFDNLILLFYLSALGVLIVLKGRADLRRSVGAKPTTGNPPYAEQNVAMPAESYFPMAIQFLLGGLFSAYAIFYSQSASLTTTAIFFALLVAFLVANEFLRDRLSNLRLLVSLYALVTFSFFTFFLPVLTGFMHTAMFLLGAVLSMLVTLRVVELVYKGFPGRSRKERLLAGLPAVAIVGVLVGFYFMKWIPPVPLSMKFGGVYHEISKVDGVYHLGYEKGAWYQIMKRSDQPFRGEGPVYCFTAVFAPVDLKTTIYHHWQYRPLTPGVSRPRPYAVTDRIPISISGGRETGYRGYTVKQRVMPGDWRVDVETEDGRIVGRVAFRVEERTGSQPDRRVLLY